MGEKVEQSRWVVPARSSQLLIMQFQSDNMGAFKENLVFEVWLAPLPVSTTIDQEYANLISCQLDDSDMLGAVLLSMLPILFLVKRKAFRCQLSL